MSRYEAICYICMELFLFLYFGNPVAMSLDSLGSLALVALPW